MCFGFAVDCLRRFFLPPPRCYMQEPSEGEEAVKAKLAALADTLQTRFRNLEDD